MAVDPVSLAVLTSAISVLGTEYSKGIASEAGKATFQKLKELFSWKHEPGSAELPQATAAALFDSPVLVKKVLELLRDDSGNGIAYSMVEYIDAKKVINIQTMHGNITM